MFEPDPVIAPAASTAVTGSLAPSPRPNLVVSIGVAPSAACNPVPVSEVVKSPLGLTSNTRALPSLAKLNPVGRPNAIDTPVCVPSGNWSVARIRTISPSVVSTEAGIVCPVGSNEVPWPAVLLDSPIIERSGVTLAAANELETVTWALVYACACGLTLPAPSIVALAGSDVQSGAVLAVKVAPPASPASTLPLNENTAEAPGASVMPVIASPPGVAPSAATALPVSVAAAPETCASDPAT